MDDKYKVIERNILQKQILFFEAKISKNSHRIVKNEFK